ncbi:hypothetical protein FP2506_01125 [Fulvimarina pelagi HTCC2506]|uniref:Uncharacterized protein n=1 Tax=Fulvimarina pelagi HTCC2506 TaxID=314231 RepID=Q0G272_9HYPH|nr:hypothetical protein FP2506_01125 [Fulvimarina pelagi HTCC2506]
MIEGRHRRLQETRECVRRTTGGLPYPARVAVGRLATTTACFCRVRLIMNENIIRTSEPSQFESARGFDDGDA